MVLRVKAAESLVVTKTSGNLAAPLGEEPQVVRVAKGGLDDVALPPLFEVGNVLGLTLTSGAPNVASTTRESYAPIAGSFVCANSIDAGGWTVTSFE
jgi:hypothetical protein